MPDDPAHEPGDPTTADRPTQVGILLYGDVEPLDFVGPAQVFWSLATAHRFDPTIGGVDVHLVAEELEPLVAGHGLVVHPTTTYETCPPLDVLVVPGGTGNEVGETAVPRGRVLHSAYEPTLAFVRRQAAQADIVASVCTGTFILAAADLIAGRSANTHWFARDELLTFMAGRGESFELVPERVVDDGDLVTGGGVSSGIALALHLVERLQGPAARSAVELIIESETPPVALSVA
jgi:cyclohexyl-isocyanide hydratase